MLKGHLDIMIVINIIQYYQTQVPVPPCSTRARCIARVSCSARAPRTGADRRGAPREGGGGGQVLGSVGAGAGAGCSSPGGGGG